jgi:hypothetical protein
MSGFWGPAPSATRSALTSDLQREMFCIISHRASIVHPPFSVATPIRDDGLT